MQLCVQMLVNDLLYVQTTTNLTIHYKREMLLHNNNRTPVIAMNFKHGPSITPSLTCIKLSYIFVNNNTHPRCGRVFCVEFLNVQA